MYQTGVHAPEKSMVQKDGIAPEVRAPLNASRQGNLAVGQGGIFGRMIMAPFVVKHHIMKQLFQKVIFMALAGLMVLAQPVLAGKGDNDGVGGSADLSGYRDAQTVGVGFFERPSQSPAGRSYDGVSKVRSGGL